MNGVCLCEMPWEVGGGRWQVEVNIPGNWKSTYCIHTGGVWKFKTFGRDSLFLLSFSFFLGGVRKCVGCVWLCGFVVCPGGGDDGSTGTWENGSRVG